ncbi:EpsG family protein [Pseudoalteromonas aurantia]|uniref:EpsG family protein n=1 Tax=Pseudoalteromonas aurantia TaxID=43654 RepID=UPI0014872B93|nr:EpsG family protein [Pseudoalteromonas aurantia]
MIEVSTNSRASYFKLVLFLSLVGFSIFPWGDGYERYKVFSDAGFYTLTGFLEKGLLQGDVVFSLIAYVINSFGLSYQYVQFVFVFIGFSLIFSHLRLLLTKVNQKERIFILFLVLFLVNIIGLANNLRYVLATIFFVCAISNAENFNNNKKFVLWSVLAGLTHFYAFFLLFFYLLISFISTKLSKSNVNKVLFFSFMFSFVLPVVVTALASVIKSGDGLIARKLASYLLGGDGAITKMVSSPVQFLNHFFKQTPFLILIVYFYIFGDKECDRVKNFLLFSSMSFSLLYFFSIYLRVGYFSLLYGVFLLISTWNYCDLRFNWKCALFVSSFVYFSLNFVYFERIISRDNLSLLNDNALCIVASPLFLIDKCTYGEQEIYEGNKQFMLLKMESIKRTMEVVGS